MTRIVALVQARMSSSRFPGKVLEDLAGVPLIVYMVRRARRAKSLDEVVVVTSTDASDDSLASALAVHGIRCLRGELHDVLARFLFAAHETAASHVVRLTGDCPLVDPVIVDGVVGSLLASGADYSSNIDPPSFPDGFDVECCTRAALERAGREATAGAEREHVTLWMRTPAAAFKRVNLRAPADLSGLRVTVDYPDDLAVVRRVVAAAPREDFDLYDVLRCLAQLPGIIETNLHVRNEGLAKSLADVASTQERAT